MSERGRVVVIFVIVGLLAGAGAYYFLAIYSPAQELKNAQAEVASWEQRYQAARDCLLGEAPGSSRTSEALAIRELAPDPWKRGSCTPLISKLTRGSAPDTGFAAIEQAWATVEQSAKAAALAFARHVSESTTLLEDPLPDALDALDAARQELRAAAQLPPAEASGTPLPTARILAIADGGAPVESLELATLPSMDGLVAFGKTSNRTVQVTLVAGGEPTVRRVGAGAMHAVPDASWGAAAAPGLTHVGALDDEGAMTSPRPLALAGDNTIAAVGGTRDDGFVVYGGTKLAIARVRGDTIAEESPIDITDADANTAIDGRVGVVWRTPDGKHFGRMLVPGGADTAPVELPEVTGPSCMTEGRVFARTIDGVASFDGRGPALTERGPSGLILDGCTRDAAVLRDLDAVMICRDTCRLESIPRGAPETAELALTDAGPLALAIHAGVLALWRKGGEPRFYALPRSVRFGPGRGVAFSDGKVIDVLGRDRTGFVVIRIPAI